MKRKLKNYYSEDKGKLPLSVFQFLKIKHFPTNYITKQIVLRK